MLAAKHLDIRDPETLPGRPFEMACDCFLRIQPRGRLLPQLSATATTTLSADERGWGKCSVARETAGVLLVSRRRRASKMSRLRAQYALTERDSLIRRAIAKCE
jgi:hypothetical protein